MCADNLEKAVKNFKSNQPVYTDKQKVLISLFPSLKDRDMEAFISVANVLASANKKNAKEKTVEK